MIEPKLLQIEVGKFKAWAETYPLADRYGEWECDYSNWGDLYEAVNNFLTSDLHGWSAEDLNMLIYAIARDNECENIIRKLSTDQVFFLAEAATATSVEPDAKWQLVVALGDYPGDLRTERLLLVFADDPDEYVRRRALVELGNIGSEQLEILVSRAWKTGEQYQRMACLHALYTAKSPHLAPFIELAEEDGREYLSAMAQRIKTRTGDYSNGDSVQ